MITAPVAKKEANVTKIHGEELTDYYHWLKQYPKVEDQQIISHLNAENDYYKAIMGPLKNQEDAIYNEIIGRIKLTDTTVPIRHDDYFYYSRTEEASNHPILCRKKDSIDNVEQVILDINELAKKSPYFNVGTTAISKDHNMIAYTSDIDGSERFFIEVKNLKDNMMLSDKIDGTIGAVVWHENNQGFFIPNLMKTGAQIGYIITSLAQL